MICNDSRYLLFCEASVQPSRCSMWRFVLEEVAGKRRLVASDVEPSACRERLELLALVRGLEAIDCPANVTLVTKSRYVDRGLKRGLAEWRSNAWRWERFGKLTPIRDDDLWRRVDRALQFHRLQSRLWRFDCEESSPERNFDWEPGGQTARRSQRGFVDATRSKVAAAKQRASEFADRLVAGEGLAVR